MNSRKPEINSPYWFTRSDKFALFILLEDLLVALVLYLLPLKRASPLVSSSQPQPITNIPIINNLPWIFGGPHWCIFSWENACSLEGSIMENGGNMALRTIIEELELEAQDLYLHNFGLQLQIQGLQARICTILELLIEQRQSIQQLEDELDSQSSSQCQSQHGKSTSKSVIQVSDSNDSNTSGM
jgi:hypothetical protein